MYGAHPQHYAQSNIAMNDWRHDGGWRDNAGLYQQQAYQPYQQAAYQAPYQHYSHQQQQQPVRGYPQAQQHATRPPPQAPRPPPGDPPSVAEHRSYNHTPNSRPEKRFRSASNEQESSQGGKQQAASSSAQLQQQAAASGGSAAAAWLNTLQQEISRFVEQAVPSAQEQNDRQSAFQALDNAARRALTYASRGTLNVLVFGSGRSGLALHSSDVDICITGIAAPNEPNGGYDRNSKKYVANCLRLVEQEARRLLTIHEAKLIGQARIPVLKLQLDSGVELDVSLNDTGGIKAANFLQSFQCDYPALKPLALVLKGILKQNHLGDVATGGLGSWSLSNMVIAHLMAEASAGGPVDHLGHMLFSFLKRFGVDWDINRDAVDVGNGGIRPRRELTMGGMPFGGQDKLALRDPLTGREVAGGSHRYADVAALFGDLYDRLQRRGPSAGSSSRGDFNVLELLLDCRAVLRRRGEPYRRSSRDEESLGWDRDEGRDRAERRDRDDRSDRAERRARERESRGSQDREPQGGGSRKRDRYR